MSEKTTSTQLRDLVAVDSTACERATHAWRQSIYPAITARYMSFILNAENPDAAVNTTSDTTVRYRTEVLKTSMEKALDALTAEPANTALKSKDAREYARMSAALRKGFPPVEDEVAFAFALETYFAKLEERFRQLGMPLKISNAYPDKGDVPVVTFFYQDAKESERVYWATADRVIETDPLAGMQFNFVNRDKCPAAFELFEACLKADLGITLPIPTTVDIPEGTQVDLHIPHFKAYDARGGLGPIQSHTTSEQPALLETMRQNLEDLSHGDKALSGPVWGLPQLDKDPQQYLQWLLGIEFAPVGQSTSCMVGILPNEQAALTAKHKLNQHIGSEEPFAIDNRHEGGLMVSAAFLKFLLKNPETLLAKSWNDKGLFDIREQAMRTPKELG